MGGDYVEKVDKHGARYQNKVRHMPMSSSVVIWFVAQQAPDREF